MAKESNTWWLTSVSFALMLCCFVHKDNKDIFTCASDLPAGRTEEKFRLDKSESQVEVRAVAKASHPVTHGDINYKMKQAKFDGMKSHIEMDKIANIKDQIQMMKDQAEMLVMIHGREQYNSLVLGLMNGLPGSGLVKQQSAPSKTDFSAHDKIVNNNSMFLSQRMGWDRLAGW
jgi:hypothetical protein